MHSEGRLTTKRLATAVALAIVLFATVLPGAAACCMVKPDSKTAAMRAAMPCCAESCTMSSPSSSRDKDAALTPAQAPQTVASTALAITPASPTATVATVATPDESAFHDFAAPPPFLVNSQFRI